jgi:predicted nucleic acid-binding protein
VKVLSPFEEGAELARETAGETTELITSRVTFVEARSALGRARRTAAISDRQLRRALRLLDEIWSDAAIIELDEPLALLAGRLVLDQVLGSFDAVQLASALAAAPTGEVTFVCWDQRLRAAARAQGFELIPA